MENSEVFEKVKNAIVDSCDVEESDITPEKTLIDQLEIDSIDLMDLLYNLEKEFNISLKIGEFENVAQSELGDVPFSKDNIVTSEGLEALKKLMPEIPAENFKEGLSIHRIPFLFTVQSLCNLVQKKLG